MFSDLPARIRRGRGECAQTQKNTPATASAMVVVIVFEMLIGALMLRRWVFIAKSQNTAGRFRQRASGIHVLFNPASDRTSFREDPA